MIDFWTKIKHIGKHRNAKYGTYCYRCGNFANIMNAGKLFFLPWKVPVCTKHYIEDNTVAMKGGDINLMLVGENTTIDGLTGYGILKLEGCSIRLPHSKSMTSAGIDYRHILPSLFSWYMTNNLKETYQIYGLEKVS